MEKHTGKIYDEDKVNELLSSLKTIIDNECWLSDKNEIVITEEHSNEHNEAAEDEEFCEEYYHGLLEPLIGYKVKLKVVGDHKHDGQLVEYDFKFTNQEGKATRIVTDMCLMQGFNYHEEVTIK